MVLLGLVVLLTGCGAPGTGPAAAHSPTAALAQTATAVPSATPRPTAVVQPSATATPRPTATASPVPTASPTPTPLPGAGLLAFESERDGNAEIYVLDTATGQAGNVTRHPAADRAPAWSPDGAVIAFASQRDGNWDIYILALADGALLRLTDDPAYDGAPAWSPDGASIAFESYRDGNLEIYAVAAAGGESRRLTDHPAGDYGPAWSPDGESIAFASWRDGNKEIYVVPAAGGEAQNLTQHPADDENPAWRLPGTLAFVSWRAADPQTGSRNAEIYELDVASGAVRRLTTNPWPDLEPAWDAVGRLTWAAYDPGPAFETYDPNRPGNVHLYRASGDGGERLTATDGDDRHPAPAPVQVSGLDLAGGEPPPTPPPTPALAPGSLAQVVPVPSCLTSYDGQPVPLNELVVPSLVAWQDDVRQASGWDLLGSTLGSWRPIEAVSQRQMFAHDYAYLSWHKTGRALDLALEYKVDGVDQMLVVREDLGASIYWRLYLRAARQDGSQGEPLKDNPWQWWWRIVPEAEPEAYAAGGKRLPVPAGYYVDVTALARRHGWARIATYAIPGDYDWHAHSTGTEYWHYERTDGLSWWQAMQQIYDLETLEKHFAWELGASFRQSEAMMRSKGLAPEEP